MHTSRSSKSKPYNDAGSRIYPDLLTRFLVLGPIVLLSFFFGGARPWIWQGVCGFFFLGLAMQFVRNQAPNFDGLKGLGIIFAVLLCLPLLQVIPLPDMILEMLSPVRAQWSLATANFGGIRAATLSYAPLDTWMGLGWWVFLGAFSMALWTALRHSSRTYPTWLMYGLFLLAGFQALYGLLQALMPALGVLWDIEPATGLAYKGYARGTFINRNHFAAFLGLLWPVLLAFILISRSPRKLELILGRRERAQDLMQKKVVGVFCLGMVVLALFFSQSRGGILAAILAFTLFFVLAGQHRKRVGLVLVGCWAVMAGYGTVIGFDGILDRFGRIEEGAAGRVELWQDGWRAVLDHPLTGTGLGTYTAVGRAYQNAFSPGQQAHHAHNDYLETTVELGLPAAAVLILGVWTLWVRQALMLWRARLTMDQDRLTLAAASLAGLGGYLLHAWVEFNNAIPANHLMAVAIAVLHFHFAYPAHEPRHADNSLRGHAHRA